MAKTVKRHGQLPLASGLENADEQSRLQLDCLSARARPILKAASLQTYLVP